MIFDSKHDETLPVIDAFKKATLLDFNSRRSTVYSTHGMVATSQPLAAQAGIDILKKGGNAADAAVATAACLNITEPCSTGIGGDAFCLYYSAKEKKVYALNGSGKSPKDLSYDELMASIPENSNEIPIDSPHSVTVPGAAAAMIDTVKNFGSGKLSLSEIFDRAVDLAENGYPVEALAAMQWERSVKLLKKASPNAEDMLLNGKAPKEGEIIRMPHLARTYREVGEKGHDAFYKGRIAEEIVKVVAERGGKLSLEDLSNHKSEFCEPISINYEGVDIYECPPNGQGIVALMALGIVEELQKSGKINRLEHMEHNGVEYLHTLIECTRIAFADARFHVTDPDFSKVKATDLLDKEYLRKRAELFDPNKANVNPEVGAPISYSNTVYLTTVDKEGNACSFIMSNYMGFGSGIIPKECGFTLQNRGCNFFLDPKTTNCYAPGKRPYHTIIPAMALKDNELYMSFGVMGGFMQPQGHLQVVLGMEHFNFTPQTALDKPRFSILPEDGLVLIEDGIDDEVVEGLIKLGHKVEVTKDYLRMNFGRGQIIRSHNDKNTGVRVLSGGSDGRADGMAIGY